jgi:hypothetical protein
MGNVMATGPMKKITAAKARDLCSHFDLTPEARPLLNDAMSPDQFLDVLIENSHFMDAIRLIAFGLPKREAVWWSCLCVREMLTPDAPPEILEVLKASEAWVYKPTEEARRGAMVKAERAGFDKAASWTAIGAFWSGGSMAPPNVPEVPPGETLTAKAASGAILLAAVQREPERATERHRQFLEDGIDIAKGGTGKKKQRPGAADPAPRQAGG